MKKYLSIILSLGALVLSVFAFKNSLDCSADPIPLPTTPEVSVKSDQMISIPPEIANLGAERDALAAEMEARINAVSTPPEEPSLPYCNERANVCFQHFASWEIEGLFLEGPGPEGMLGALRIENTNTRENYDIQLEVIQNTPETIERLQKKEAEDLQCIAIAGETNCRFEAIQSSKRMISGIKSFFFEKTGRATPDCDQCPDHSALSALIPWNDTLLFIETQTPKSEELWQQFEKIIETLKTPDSFTTSKEVSTKPDQIISIPPKIANLAAERDELAAEMEAKIEAALALPTDHPIPSKKSLEKISSTLDAKDFSSLIPNHTNFNPSGITVTYDPSQQTSQCQPSTPPSHPAPPRKTTYKLVQGKTACVELMIDHASGKRGHNTHAKVKYDQGVLSFDWLLLESMHAFAEESTDANESETRRKEAFRSYDPFRIIDAALTLWENQ